MFIVTFVTAKDQQEAQKIAEGLLKAKVAACVNIIPGVRSLFWWEGKIDTGDEVLMVIKSKKNLFKKIVKTVKSLHSYSVPEIIALPIIDGSKDYLKWIKESVEK